MRWRTLIGSTALTLTLAASAALGGEVVSRNVETSAPPYAVFLNAAPKPLARVSRAPRTSAGTAGTRAEQPRSRPGSPGGDVESAIQIIPEAANRQTAPAAAIMPKAVGLEGFPFTTSRVELAPNARASRSSAVTIPIAQWAASASRPRASINGARPR